MSAPWHDEEMALWLASLSLEDISPSLGLVLALVTRENFESEPMRLIACWGSTPSSASKVASKKLLSDSGCLRSSPLHAASGEGGASRKESMAESTLSLVSVHASVTLSMIHVTDLMKFLVVQKNMIVGIQKKDVSSRNMHTRMSSTRPHQVLCRDSLKLVAASASEARSRVYGSMEAWERFDMDRENARLAGREESSSHPSS